MKQAMINYMQQEKNDELYTPDEAIIPILKYLDHNKIYWECTDFGESNISKVLKERSKDTIYAIEMSDAQKLKHSNNILDLIEDRRFSKWV